MANLKGIAAGAALGTLLGSLAIAFYPKRKEILEALNNQTMDLSERAREYADMWMNRNQTENNTNGHLTSGLVGLLVGAGIALAVAPKTGKQFRTQFIRAYNELFGKTQNMVEFFRNNSHPIRHAMKTKKRTTANAKRVAKTKH